MDSEAGSSQAGDDSGVQLRDALEVQVAQILETAQAQQTRFGQPVAVAQVQPFQIAQGGKQFCRGIINVAGAQVEVPQGLELVQQSKAPAGDLAVLGKVEHGQARASIQFLGQGLEHAIIKIFHADAQLHPLEDMELARTRIQDHPIHIKCIHWTLKNLDRQDG
jgi:hypothetical protein